MSRMRDAKTQERLFRVSGIMRVPEDQWTEFERAEVEWAREFYRIERETNPLPEGHEVEEVIRIEAKWLRSVRYADGRSESFWAPDQPTEPTKWFRHGSQEAGFHDAVGTNAVAYDRVHQGPNRAQRRAAAKKRKSK